MTSQQLIFLQMIKLHCCVVFAHCVNSLHTLSCLFVFDLFKGEEEEGDEDEDNDPDFDPNQVKYKCNNVLLESYK